MKLKKVFLVSCLSIIMCSTIAWAKPTEFSIKVNSGDKYSIHVVKDEDTIITFESGENKIKETLEMKMNVYIREVDKDKNLSIDCEYESIKLSKEVFGRTVEYNTENKNINNPLNNMYRSFIGKSFTINLNNKGKVLNLSGVKELLTSIADTSGTSNEEKLFIKEELNKKFGEEIIKGTVKKSLNYYPEKDVEVGEIWETKYYVEEAFPINYFNKFEILNEKDGILNIDMESKINSSTKNTMGTNIDMEGTCKGIIEIYKETGMPKSLSFNRVIKGCLSHSNSGEKAVVPIRISEKLTYEFIKK